MVERAATEARTMLAKGKEPFAWSVVDTGAVAFPAPIRSAWVFVQRAGSLPEPHRHPNSAQHLRSLRGSGHVMLSTPDGRPGGRWLLDARSPWLVIAQDILHAIQVPPAQDWTVVSFHTVPAAHLLEVAASGERYYHTDVPTVDQAHGRAHNDAGR
jgi:hypothetical protein